tara:strand:+ start:64 stop:294 length:231 start_codon:yes stop_codon:yes gene_type:complete
MTDKIFVTKENLEKALSFKEKNKVGLFTSICIVIWLICLFPFFAGIIFTSLLMLLFAIPFYAIDQLLHRSSNNAKN